MYKNFTIEVSENITIVPFFTSPTKDDFISAIDDVASNYPNCLRLWDLSQSGLNLNATELRHISDYGKAKFHLPSKVAIIAPEDLAYGLSRTFEVYQMEDHIEMNVFPTVQHGLTWLKTSF